VSRRAKPFKLHDSQRVHRCEAHLVPLPVVRERRRARTAAVGVLLRGVDGPVQRPPDRLQVGQQAGCGGQLVEGSGGRGGFCRGVVAARGSRTGGACGDAGVRAAGGGDAGVLR
jgi:hypothetical protein